MYAELLSLFIVCLMIMLVIRHESIVNDNISSIRLETVNTVMRGYLGYYWPLVILTIIIAAKIGTYID